MAQLRIINALVSFPFVFISFNCKIYNYFIFAIEHCHWEFKPCSKQCKELATRYQCDNVALLDDGNDKSSSKHDAFASTSSDDVESSNDLSLSNNDLTNANSLSSFSFDDSSLSSGDDSGSAGDDDLL